MNEIFDVWNDLWNFFLPTYKLKEKIRFGARIKKVYDKPQTPFQRLIESRHLSEGEKAKLLKRKSELDPFRLNEILEVKLAEFFKRNKTLNFSGDKDAA